MNFGQNANTIIEARTYVMASRLPLRFYMTGIQCNLRVKDALGLGFVLLREVVHWLEVTKLMYCWYTFGTTKSVL